MNGRLAVVVTTIQAPTVAMRQLAAALEDVDMFVVVGDKRGPDQYPIHGAQFLSFDDQQQLAFELAPVLPANHYARKNLGYLSAMAAGAQCIYETDDDNAPLASWGRREREVTARRVVRRGWFNAYRAFGGTDIWPRGFPLDQIHSERDCHEPLAQVEGAQTAVVQQGLANGSPDVDAIWRLVLDRTVIFDSGPSVWLPRGTWCPFNSQSTWWWPEAYALMYLPSTVSFRMTDIWRGFVAQRCLWEIGFGLAFHEPEVVQERNVHDLMADFVAEQDGYLRNDDLVSRLERLRLRRGPHQVVDNLRLCYEMMAVEGMVQGQELDLLEAWIADVEAISCEAAGS